MNSSSTGRGAHGDFAIVVASTPGAATPLSCADIPRNT